ncbi:MAG: hypothetical protein R8M11_05455 [Gallionella sp.]
MRFPAFFLAGVIAVTSLVHEVSATPLFSRQAGITCSACHFQHFPMLNGFGRAFKSAGYTMIGSQEKVPGEGLSIPTTLNMAVVTTTGYEKSNMAEGAYPVRSTGNGVTYLPGSGGELSLFFGGRISEISGFVGELSVGDVVDGGHSAAKMPIDISAMFTPLPTSLRISFVPFATDSLGASYGFETLNTGANVVHQMVSTYGINASHSGAFSAQQYIGTDGPAKGVALVASHPRGFINVTRFDRTGITDGRQASTGSLYVRVVGFFNWGNWDAAAGVQMWNGKSAVGNPNAATAAATPLVTAETKAKAIDGQLQGSLGNIPIGFYASYATAPAVAASTGFLGNAYNTFYTQDVPTAPTKGIISAGHATKSSLNVSTEIGVIPDKATIGAGIRIGKSGDGKTDNAIMLMGTYKVAHNMLASLTVTSASGSYWYSNATNTGTTDLIGNTTYTVNLFTAF